MFEPTLNLSIMTYQTTTPNYDTADVDADDSSLLVLTAVDASPSFSLGQDDGVATKKNGVPDLGSLPFFEVKK